MEAWRQQGYVPAGGEQLLKDYEDKLQVESNKRDLIYTLRYTLPPPQEYTRGDVYADANAYAESGASAAASEAVDRNDPTVGGQRRAATPALGAFANIQPNSQANPILEANRPAWADHVEGIDTPTLETILAQRYAMQRRGDDANGPSANPRTNGLLRPAFLPDNRQDTGQEGATPADPYAPMVQNLSSRVVNAGGGRGFVNPADASTHGSTSFAGRSTITDPKAFGQPQLDPRERELQLLRMSDEPAEAHSAAEWAAAAQEYKELQIRQGRKFSRDSFYNGLWTKGMAAGAAAGKMPGRGDFNDMAGLAGEARLHSEVGTAAGGAAGAAFGAVLGKAARIAARQGEEKILVYRGTDRTTENNIYDATGHLLSEAARQGFMEGGLPRAYAASEAVHKQWLDLWGSEDNYVQAHGKYGQELRRKHDLDRTFVSVTTEPGVAEKFRDGGTIYSGYVPKSMMRKQTLPGSTEYEYLIPHGTNLLKPIIKQPNP